MIVTLIKRYKSNIERYQISAITYFVYTKLNICIDK